MTAAEACAAAATEELTLLRAEKATGFRGVTRDSTRNLRKPFQVQLIDARRAQQTSTWLGETS